jgi:drug/metabolite transporter (DMT)-like permease
VTRSAATAWVALTSAALWGGGDFSGGMGVKRAGGGVAGAVRFVMLAHSLSLFTMTVLALVLHEHGSFGAPAFWAMAAGSAGAVGCVAFYSALSRGGMGVSAAICGLLTAAVPVVVSIATEGAPRALQLAGFAVAAAAIWLIASGDSPENEGGVSRQTLLLAIFAGFAFGIYFVALSYSKSLGLVLPMVFARSASLLTLGTILLFMGRGAWLQVAPKNWFAGLGWAVGVSLMDTGGNMFFLGATRLGRLDVASVLAGLYPAGTILLAAWWLKERPTRRQVIGMITALVAVVMITK